MWEVTQAKYEKTKLEYTPQMPHPPGQCELIWKAGDLNKLMESIMDDSEGSGEWTQYNPTVLSWPKKKRNETLAHGVEEDGSWRVLLDDFLTPVEPDGDDAEGRGEWMQ